MYEIAGLAVRNFHGFSSLKEIECSGSTLPNEVNYLSLKLFKSYQRNSKSSAFSNKIKNVTLTSLVTSENVCHTYAEFASCFIDDSDRRNSVLKTLVSDLDEGETITIGCAVNAVFKVGQQIMFEETWTIDVHRKSE